MSNIVLVLTACIKPNTACCLTLTDIQTRASQYRKAIIWYFEHTDYPIVFAENSESTLDIPSQINSSPRFEYISFLEQNDSYDRGKGYKEARILEYVQSHSTLYSSADIVIKVTGRLIIRNISAIISSFPQEFGDKGFCGQFERRFHRLDTRFFIASKKVFSGLMLFNPLIDDLHEPRLIFEGAYALALTEMLIQKCANYYYPRHIFDYEGSGGGSGINYTRSTTAIALLQFFHSLAFPFLKVISPILIVRNHKEWLIAEKERLTATIAQ